jgi:hypothetical protein
MRVTLTDAAGNMKNSFSYGEKVCVRTVISGSLGMPFTMNVSVKNDMGTFITDHISSNDGFTPEFLADEVTVTTEFECVFNDGTYFLQLWLGDRARKMNDVVRNCLSFNVFSSDVQVRSRGLLRQKVLWDIC